jgi:steroid 5-alpha reductase family enzyme
MTAFLPALWLGLAAMASLWALSVARRDSSLVDYWWAPGFAFGATLVWALSGAPFGGAQILALVLVVAWAMRMTALFIRRRAAHPGEDPRYADIRRAWGAGFWWKSLFIVFLLQAVLQWLVATPALAVAAAPAAPVGPLAAAGGAIAILGLLIESRADAELDAHKAGPDAASVCATGLRRFVRYPNYSAEVLFWGGLWLIAGAVGAWWTALGPALLALLLARVSGAPILDERLEGRPGAPAWMDSTPAFLPRLSALRARGAGQ